jgi:hypothetical protein
MATAAEVDRRRGGWGVSLKKGLGRGGREKGRGDNGSALLRARQGGRGKGRLGSGRRPSGGEGLGTVWGTDAAVGRRGVVGTGLESACAGGRRMVA